MVDETTSESQADTPDPTGDAPTDSTAPIHGAPGELPADNSAVTEPAAKSATPEPVEPQKPESTTFQPHRVASADDSTDVGTISDEPAGAPTPPIPQRRAGDWQAEMSARRLAIELRGIETKIRELLQDRDTRRRRKLAGTYRWRELEEDLIEWRYNRRIDPDTVSEIQRLICRRHFLFTQLRFAAATRPTWNS